LREQCGIWFAVRVSSFEENFDKKLFSPAEYVLATATRKALDVAAELRAEHAKSKAPAATAAPLPDIVIGADTIVVLNGSILEKPKDAPDAVRMLTALSGQTHCVMTAVAIVLPKRTAASAASAAADRSVRRDCLCHDVGESRLCVGD
jgi:septum formation protein